MIIGLPSINAYNQRRPWTYPITRTSAAIRKLTLPHLNKGCFPSAKRSPEANNQTSIYNALLSRDITLQVREKGLPVKQIWLD